MQAATVVNAPKQGPTRPRRWPMNVSRAGSAVFVLLYFFVYPLCYCPHYYLELSVIGLLPLVCGPRLYRYLGAAIILCGLLSAEADRRGVIRERQQIREIRVAADIQGISTQLKLYERMNGFYPTTAQGLQALVTQPDNDPRPTRWYQLYKKVPKDPWQTITSTFVPGSNILKATISIPPGHREGSSQRCADGFPARISSNWFFC